MKKSSLDVFDFNEQDKEAEVIAAKYSSKFKDSEALDKCSFPQNGARGRNMQSKERSNVARVDVDSIIIDNTSECAASFASINGEVSCFAEELPQSRQSKDELRSCQMGGSSVSEIAFPENIRFKCPRDESSSEESFDAVSGDDGSLFDTSPSNNSFIGDDYYYGDDDDVHLDGSANDWTGYMQMVDGELGVACFPDYIVYRDKHLEDSVIIFSSSCIRIKNSTHYVEDETFEFQWEIDDVISVQSQWCERTETAIVKIHVISNGSVLAGDLQGTSGIEELKFSIVGDWCGRQNAITSMDVYKPLWKTVLDSELNRNSEVSLGDKGVLPSDHYFPKFDKAFEDLTYPKGDIDSVSISKRDIDLLQPDTFVNDTIIDFYITYLKYKIEPGERHRFHFFNCFFFRKLADLDKNPSSAVEGRAAFQRVRKWTRKINLFEKDYLFVPVNFKYHWSLIVICYPGEVAKFQDRDPHKSLRIPCILHMDSIRGSHSGLKSLLQSYLCEEWKERQKDSPEDISSRFLNLRFLSPELPQQQNSYDCGLFLLHYVELFLKGVPVNFNPFQLTKLSKFLTPDWFVPYEASLKRAYIERIVYDLLDNGGSHQTSYGAGSRKEFVSHCSTSSFENGTTNGFIAARRSPSKAFHGNAMSSQTGQELKLGDAIGSIYQSLEQSADSAPLNEFKNVKLQGEKETDGCYGSTAAAETGHERFVATTYQESDPFLSTEFRGEPSWNLRASVHQIVPEDFNSLRGTSVCVNKALDIEAVNHALEGTNPNFEVNIDQSRPPEDNEECAMITSPPRLILEIFSNNSPDHIHRESEDADLVTTCPANLLGSSAQDAGEEGIKICKVPQSFPVTDLVTNEPDTDLVTNVVYDDVEVVNHGLGIRTCEGSQSLLDTDLVTNELHDDVEVVNRGLEGTNSNFEVNIDQSRPLEDKDDSLGSAPCRILGQVSNNSPHHIHPDSEDANFVTTFPENLLGSSAQDFDAEEEGLITTHKVSQSIPNTDIVTDELHDAKRRKLISLEGRLPESFAEDLRL